LSQASVVDAARLFARTRMAPWDCRQAGRGVCWTYNKAYQETIMKLRLASPSLAARLHGPLRFGRAWRGHELALRIIQLVVLITLAAVGARLVAEGVALLMRTIAALVA
jgi:hypothetical protein